VPGSFLAISSARGMDDAIFTRRKDHTASWRLGNFQKVVGEEKEGESLPIDILQEEIYMYRKPH
jgi:hypothetical protein